MIISLIAAASINRVIGLNGELPWHLPADLRYFREKTLGHHILMGRKTWEAFPRPLPGRTSIVLGHMQHRLPEGVFPVESLSSGIELAKERGETELMIIGGGQVYEAALPFAQKIFLTHVLTKISGGTALFPVISAMDWKIVSCEFMEKDEKNPFSMEFMELRRRNSEATT
jgi:dihydrofolate reductase